MQRSRSGFSNVVGCLVAKYSLLDLGFAEFELFRSRYVFIGLLFIQPFVICAAIAYLLCSTSHSPFIARHRVTLSVAIGNLVALSAFRPTMQTARSSS